MEGNGGPGSRLERRRVLGRNNSITGYGGGEEE